MKAFTRFFILKFTVRNRIIYIILISKKRYRSTWYTNLHSSYAVFEFKTSGIKGLKLFQVYFWGIQDMSIDKDSDLLEVSVYK